MEIEIVPAEAVDTRTAPAAYFTGHVLQDQIPAVAGEPQLSALRVAFAPGARTNWHTHPHGQTLHVLSGIGLVQARGGPARVIREGDTVRIPAGLEHWHGATGTRTMTHLALQHQEDGRAADWLEPVSEADYAAAHP